MRRTVFLGVLLSIALFAVIYGKSRLDSFIKEGKLDTPETPAPTAVDQANTIDIGVAPKPGQAALNEAPPHAAGSTHQDVMTALVQARQSFRNKETVTKEAGADPHTTPNSIVRSAEKLGEIITLEEAHPEYRPEFQAFYLECTKDDEVITVTRVQCLEKYIKSKKLTGSEEQQLLSEVPPLVKKLYLEIK